MAAYIFSKSSGLIIASAARLMKIVSLFFAEIRVIMHREPPSQG